MEPIWNRNLTEQEWQALLADDNFLQRLRGAVKEGISAIAEGGGLLLIENWPREAHLALFDVLPADERAAFDLAIFQEDGRHADLDETVGYRMCMAWEVDGPAGSDERRLTPRGSPMPLGPYADLVLVSRVPHPLRLEVVNGIKVSVHAVEGEPAQGVYLVIGRWGGGGAQANDDGSFTILAFDEKTLRHIPTEERISDLDTLCTHFMAVGRAEARREPHRYV